MSKPPSIKTLNAQNKLVIGQGVASAVVAVAQSVQTIIEGTQYRASLRAIVETLQADQSLRHQDVSLLLEILDRYGSDMSPPTRDEYFNAILVLLSATGLRDRLLPPPS